MTQYEAVIGLEVHVQLHTRSKLFCGCAVVEDTGDVPPNTAVCPVCTGMPGALPVINRRAIEYGVMTGLALNCQVADFCLFERKNYFYPDLPSGYQRSMYQFPLCYDGWIEVKPSAGGAKRIRIRRAHLEEDAGKLYHRDKGASLVDLNRAGVPLLEIVTEPDFRSADQAYAYLTQLRTLVRYLGVSSGDMEKGAMRCEPNLSLRPVGSQALGTRIEVKNLNSFRAVRGALAYEIERQTQVLSSGGRVEQVTLGWDPDRQQTVVQRVKEESQDYRYFPDPDLPPLQIEPAWVAEIQARLPELAAAKQTRFVSQLGLSAYDAQVLVADRAVAEYFEAVVAAGGDPRLAANWITGELFKRMNEGGLSIEEVAGRMPPENLVGLLDLVADGTINQTTAKEVLADMLRGGQTARDIVDEQGLAQISDDAALAKIVTQVLDEHPQQVESYLSGKESLIGWLMGQVMRHTQGQANPQIARRLLREGLHARRDR